MWFKQQLALQTSNCLGRDRVPLCYDSCSEALSTLIAYTGWLVCCYSNFSTKHSVCAQAHACIRELKPLKTAVVALRTPSAATMQGDEL